MLIEPEAIITIICFNNFNFQSVHMSLIRNYQVEFWFCTIISFELGHHGIWWDGISMSVDWGQCHIKANAPQHHSVAEICPGRQPANPKRHNILFTVFTLGLKFVCQCRILFANHSLALDTGCPLRTAHLQRIRNSNSAFRYCFHYTATGAQIPLVFAFLTEAQREERQEPQEYIQKGEKSFCRDALS